MDKIKNIDWFKNEIANNLKGYELIYKSFEDGDFGSLNQVEFNSEKISGNIDFWGLGWLGIFVWDSIEEQELLNILLEPHQNEEKEKALKKMQELL
ncbi:hypothetical protein EG359_11230 [Chryseobacterium joostei]|uniref:Uncharacterized protein n=1 Tax=Chryseobacterium joostei TaxID=112234 RepID=A0A1N7IGS3_9FLAO|nr:hypothetical protein [Chryseobacterium joostei]AZB00161.1 hypothetical protein EG359_11230 [Chryseobacterium joostei]SIS36299.1 hypothetical protein SAMN05421768_105167 [Chryseobacterium joostei]